MKVRRLLGIAQAVCCVLAVSGEGQVHARAHPAFEWAIQPEPDQSDAKSLGASVQVDAEGNSYLVAQGMPGIRVGALALRSDRSFGVSLLAKYSPAGSLLWAVGAPANRLLLGFGSLVTPSKEFFLPVWRTSVGQISDPSALIKFDNNGTILWERSTIPDLFSPSSGASIGQNGFVLSGGGSKFVRYDRELKVVWSYEVSQPAAEFVSFHAMAADADENLFVGGTFTGSRITLGTNTLMKGASLASNDSQPFLTKFGPSGELQWALSIPLERSGSPAGLGTDAAGSCYALASYSVYQVGTGASLLKFDANGSKLWQKELNQPQFGNEIQLNRLSVTPSGRCAVTGSFTSGSPPSMGGPFPFAGTNLISKGDWDVLISVFDQDGNPSWTVTLGSPGRDNLNGVSWSPSGDIIITGAFGGSAELGNLGMLSAATDRLFLASITESPRPPSVAEQPRDQSVLKGSSVGIQVAAQGTPKLSFAWRKDGLTFQGPSTNQLVITNFQANDAGKYSVVITSPCGSITSSPAILSLTADSDRDGLTDDWERGFGRYEVVPGVFTWTEANEDAERRGGHLATIINDQEWRDLKQILGPKLFGKNLWLGGTDEGTEGRWRWVTGEIWSFANWRANEPGNDSLGNGQGVPENYLMIWGNETEPGDAQQLFWNDATVAGGVLAKDGYLLEQGSWTDPNDPDTDDDGLSDGEEGQAGNSYEIISVAWPPGISWLEAKKDAEARHGHLATITSEDEWTKVLSMVGDNVLHDAIWLGASDSIIEGQWHWVTGEPFVYTRWIPGEPNNAGDEDYLHINSNSAGSWNDLPASSLLPKYLLELESWDSDPNNPDTDADGLKDGDEAKFLKTNPTRSDSDNDGLSDSDEVMHWRTNPLLSDTDQEGLSDADEVIKYHTDPNKSDTDGDGLSDKMEIDMMSNPLLASSIPGVPAQIRKAVEIHLETQRDTFYAVQRLMPDGSWEKVGLSIFAEGGSVNRLFSLSLFPQGVWRVVVDLQPSFQGLAYIPPGNFVMGSPESETGRYDNETQHKVTLTKGFWMGQREVTQGEYFSVMGENPSYFTNDISAVEPGTGGRVTNHLSHPVESVTWTDAKNYCERLTLRDRGAGLIPVNHAYRLPTEAEWEYACRAGKTNAFSFGSAIRKDKANFDTRSEYESAEGPQVQPATGLIYRTIEVGSYTPNAFGLFDMHGNVSEWCADWRGTYPASEVTDPTGPRSGLGDGRVFRGGAWRDEGRVCRAAVRGSNFPDQRSHSIGFRVVLAKVQ